ncbi:MAG TPA: hypothetical protein VLE74_03315 [Candidatus Saccharimonadales bacterium]|nr:hypothetical protein [Candidatus Saccharimonadales bacterium]
MRYRVEREFYIPSDIQPKPIDRQTLHDFGVAGYSNDEKASLTKIMIRGEDHRTEWDVLVRGHHDDGHRVLGRIVCGGVGRGDVLPITRDWLQSTGFNVFEIVQQDPSVEDGLVVVRGITLVQPQPVVVRPQQM